MSMKILQRIQERIFFDGLADDSLSARILYRLKIQLVIERRYNRVGMTLMSAAR
jgi:hypothetical protein